MTRRPAEATVTLTMYTRLKEVQEVMGRVTGVAFIYLDHRDVVRHPLVQRVIQAYDEHHARRRNDR